MPAFTFNDTFINEFKYWCKSIFKDKMNYFIPVAHNQYIVTRMDKNAQDKRDIAEIIITQPLDYDSPVHYLEIKTELLEMKVFSESMVLCQEEECLVISKNRLKDAITPITRLLTLHKKLNYQVPVDEVFACTSYRSEDSANRLLIKFTDKLDAFVAWLSKVPLDQLTTEKPANVMDGIARYKSFKSELFDIGYFMAKELKVDLIKYCKKYNVGTKFNSVWFKKSIEE